MNSGLTIQARQVCALGKFRVQRSLHAGRISGVPALLIVGDCPGITGDYGGTLLNSLNSLISARILLRRNLLRRLSITATLYSTPNLDRDQRVGRARAIGGKSERFGG